MHPKEQGTHCLPNKIEWYKIKSMFNKFNLLFISVVSSSILGRLGNLQLYLL